MFAGQEKSSFSMYNGINLLNSMTFSLKAYKRREICIHFTNWFFPKVFTGNEKCNFDRTTETFLLNSRFFWLKMRKNLKQNCNFFSEFFFHRSVSWTPNNAILTNLLQWLRRINEILLAQSRNWSENCKFFKGNYVFRKVPLHTEKAVLYALSDIISAAVQFFLFKVQEMNKSVHTLAKRFFIWMLAGRKKCRFESLAETIFLSLNIPPLKNWKWWKAL